MNSRKSENQDILGDGFETGVRGHFPLIFEPSPLKKKQRFIFFLLKEQQINVIAK